MTQSWGDIQEQHYRDTKEDKKLTGTRWVRLLLKEFFSTLEILWQRRNERVHPEQKTEREILKKEIEELQSMNLYVPKNWNPYTTMTLMTSLHLQDQYPTYDAGFALSG